MPPAGTVGTPGPVSLPCPVLAIRGHRGIRFALAPCPPRHLCSLLFLLPVGSRRKRTAIARGPLCGSLGFELCHQSQGRLRREGRNPASLCCWGRAGCGPSLPGSTPQTGTLQPRALISGAVLQPLVPWPVPIHQQPQPVVAKRRTAPSCAAPCEGWELGRAKGAGVLPPPLCLPQPRRGCNHPSAARRPPLRRENTDSRGFVQRCIPHC